MFRVGDKVRVRGYSEIEKDLDLDGILIGDGIRFAYDMERDCGQLFEISHVYNTIETQRPRVRLRNSDRVWHPIWLVPQIIDNRSVM
jgi:hypothetical protein